MTDTKLQNAYKAAEEKRHRAAQSAEDKRRHAAIVGDKDTIPMDFGAESSATTKSKIALISEIMAVSPEIDWEKCNRNQPTSSQLQDPSSQPEPLWKRVWRAEGIRYLGRGGYGVIDAMERFEHAFMLGYRAGVGDMLGEAQWLIKGK